LRGDLTERRRALEAKHTERSNEREMQYAAAASPPLKPTGTPKVRH